jgi:hypothetical protein
MTSFVTKSNQPDPPLRQREGTPASFGWMRAPTHDVDALEAWERPDGEIFFVRRGVTRITVPVVSKPRSLWGTLDG